MARRCRQSTRRFLCESVLLFLWFQTHVEGETVNSDYWSEWSSWSSCSAYCEYGISTRTRQCLRGGTPVEDFTLLQVNTTWCNGSSSEIKVCRLKACPPEQPSNHQRSCSQYDSRIFSGKQYVWEPLIHPNDACKLSCRAKGVHFYANLADKAEDGTPCKLGTTEAVCVKGVCKRVGCDGIVESGAVKDICGVCSGDSSSCQTISGIFTSTDLKRGLNYVISIPAGSTNINITELLASRNLLILQTATGKTLINDDTSSPTSAVVEAAGTVFTYGAQSATSKESIFSPGPTNMSVILKLLMRGSNPGIMYTFSVPKEFSDTVIQQIRHHAQPVELPPDPVDDRHPQFQASSSKDDGSISLINPTTKRNSSGSTNGPPFMGPGDSRFDDNGEMNQNPEQEVSTPGITHTEILISPISESTTTVYGRSSSVFTEDSDNINRDNSLPGSSESDGHTKELLPLDMTSQKAPVSQYGPGEHTLDNENNLDYGRISKDTEAAAVQLHNGHEDLHANNYTATDENLDQKRIQSEATKSSGTVIDDEIDNDYNNKRHSNNGTGHLNIFSNISSSVDKERITSEADSYKNIFNDNRLHTPEAEPLLWSTQSTNFPRNSVINPSEIGHTNPYSRNSDLGDNSLIGSTESILNKNVYPDVSNVDTPRTSQNVDNHDGFDKDETSSQSSVKNRSKYKIPRYSQSFTFAERYKDNHILNNSSQNSQISRARNHSRRRHRHHQNNSQNASSHQYDQGSSQNTQYGTVSSANQQIELERNPSRNIDRQHSAHSSYTDLNHVHERKGNVERGNSVSEFAGSYSVVRNIQASTPANHHSNGDEQVSREMRLRDRQVLMEDRRRRMEEQRLRYNERLREYQERLRQRQAEIVESNKRSSQPVNTPRLTDPRTSDGSSNHRRPYQQENNPSPISRDDIVPSSQQGSRSTIDTKKHLSHPDLTDTGKATQGYDWSLIRNANTYTGTDLRSQAGRSVGSLDTRRQQDFEQRPGAIQETEASLRRQAVLQPSRGEDGVNDSSRIISRESGTFNNDPLQSRETFTGQGSSPNIPIVKQPPRLEYPDSFDEDRTIGSPTRNIQRVQPSGPRYIPGSPSQAAVHSALTAPEVPLGSSANKISGDSHISPSRLPSESSQFGSMDLLLNQASLNTLQAVHNTIYEWRISGLTECTHSCGGGVQQTVVVCVDTLTQAVVTDENCKHVPRPKQLAVPCNTRPCSAEWTPGPWSSCSVTCGMGEQTRIVTCQARVSPTLNMTMPSSSCESQERIPSLQTCNTNPCSSWRVGIWSNCSTPCGDGQKTRDVHCVDLQDNVLSDDACSELRPDSEERCNLGECGKGWFFTDWPTECPVDCGQGELTRQVFCADDTGSALPDNRCDMNLRPATSQPCRVSRPCGGLWFTGQWSKCDAKCGSGNRQRDVLCIKELSGSVHAVVDGENCEGLDKPMETETCQGPPCTSEWYMTSWSQCSQSCGTGYRTREVKCLDSGQKSQDDCPLQTRPRTRDACNIHDCVDAEVGENEEDQNCTDKFAQCKVVKRARLCRYGYYKTVCCKSCADDT